jgi:hypothetical protein
MALIISDHTASLRLLSESAKRGQVEQVDSLLATLTKQGITIEKILTYAEWWNGGAGRSSESVALIKRRSFCKCGNRAASWESQPLCSNCSFRKTLSQVVGL